MADKWETLVKLLEETETPELERLQEQIALVKRSRKDDVPEDRQGSPSDPAVQKLAAWALEYMRNPDFRKSVRAAYSDDEIVPYEAISVDVAHVSRERVRRLYKQFRPFSYEAQKRSS